MARDDEIFRTLSGLSPAELAAFLAVSSHGGFRAASRALGTSPSALSHAVAALESRLKVQLFLRTTRNVSLTDPGRQFAEALAPAFAQIGHAVSSLNEYNKKPTGLIRINAASAAVEQVLESFIAPFLKSNPDMRIEILSEGKLVDIARDGFDCGIRAKQLVPVDMVAVPIGPDLQHIVVASPSYLLAAPPLTSPADLTRHHCIQLRLPSGGLYRWEFERHREIVSVDTHGRLVLDNSSQIRAAALGALGLGYVSKWVVEKDLASSALVNVLAEWTPPYPGLCMYYPRHRHLNAGMKAFVEFARHGLAGR